METKQIINGLLDRADRVADESAGRIMRQAAERLRELDQEQKWIHVTERLPDRDSDYLVMKAFGEQRWCDVISFAKDGRKVNIYTFEREWENVWYFYDSEWGYITTNSVTHWMPLPEPPKEVDHESES